MFDDLVALHEELGRVLDDVRQNFSDMHPEDVAGILRNAQFKALELAGDIGARHQYIVEEVLPEWEVTNAGHDAGMPPASPQELS